MIGGNKKILKKLACVCISILFMTVSAKATLVDSNSIIEDGIEYYIQTDKAVYNLGEDVDILYRITNLRTEMWQVTDFPPLRDILVAKRKEQDFIEIWRLSWFRNYPPGPRVLRLYPGESSEMNVIWPQIDAQGTRDPIDDISIAPGIYRITGVLDGYITPEPPTEIHSRVSVNITIVPEAGSIILFVVGLPLANYINRRRKDASITKA